MIINKNYKTVVQNICNLSCVPHCSDPLVCVGMILHLLSPGSPRYSRASPGKQAVSRETAAVTTQLPARNETISVPCASCGFRK